MINKKGDFKTNLKASLAAPIVNVINEDDRDLESSSSEDGSRAGSEIMTFQKRKLSNPRKISDVMSDDYQHIQNINENPIDSRSMASKSRAFSIFEET